jgi:hypothetical protein
VETAPGSYRVSRLIAAGLAIVLGAVTLFGLPLSLDRRFLRVSIPGARGPLLYLATD